MARNSNRSLLIDEILRIATLTTLTATVLLAPNSVQMFDKRIQSYLSKMDKQKREREIQNTLRYIRQQRLISEDYQHGIIVTKKALKRIKEHKVNYIELPSSEAWDGHWRMVFFDIPEKHKSSRDAFAAKIRGLGFKVIQRSVFVYPFECREQVEVLVSHYKVSKYVSYVEVTYIDNQLQLIKKFKGLI